jgi:hypothetical protein
MWGKYIGSSAMAVLDLQNFRLPRKLIITKVM